MRWTEFTSTSRLRESCDLLRVDLHGFGDSISRRRTGFDQWCRDLASILDAERVSRAVIVGHCLGANVAIHFAARYPSRTEGLVLIEPMFREAMTGARRALLRLRFVPGALVAIIFTAVGAYLGLRWTRRKEVVVVREVLIRDTGPFALNTANLQDLGLTQREHEILTLIAQGLSNREIGERLFIAENTVKTHSSRLFEKMAVSRRTQAVQRGKELGLIP